MIGNVDASRRALLEVLVQRNSDSPVVPITVWVDTAFTGYFVFPRALIESLKLDQLSTTEAILADGSKVSHEAYFCYVDWFGQLTPAQAIANDGQLPLLGTELLDKRLLSVDYVKGHVTLD